MMRFRAEITDAKTGEITRTIIREDNIQFSMETLMQNWLDGNISDYQLWILRGDQWIDIDEYAIEALLTV